MTIWLPKLSSDTSKYVAIADAIASDIANSSLQPGQQLPTQRDLAERLGVTIGTVGRAYALAEKRGLISLEIGRGSFVKTFESPSNQLGNQCNLIDLGLNLPPQTEHADLFARTLAQISNTRNIGQLFADSPVESFKHHRNAAAKWLGNRLQCRPEDALIFSGTQNALVASLAALTKPHDSVLVETFTFPGMIAAAKLLHLNLVPVPMDRSGIIPSELDRLSRKASVLYCIPTNQNPTTSTLPKTRRQEIAKIAKRNGLHIIEDDVYGLLIEGCPEPIAAYAPEQTILVASLAKTLSVGLRLAYARVPRSIRQEILSNIRASSFFPAPLLCEIATRWIDEGVAKTLLDERRSVALKRQAIARETLPIDLISNHPKGNHIWMQLPSVWSADTLVRAAQENGVNLYAADCFVVTPDSAVDYVRLSLGAARNESELRIGLGVLNRLLSDRSEIPSARY